MGDILLLYNVVSVFSCKSKSKGPSPSPPPPPPVYYYPPPPPKGPDTTTEPLETTTSTETTATTQFFVKTDKYTLLESKYTKKLTNPEFDKFPYIPGSKKPYQDWRKKHKKQKPKIIKGPGSRKPGGGPGGGPGGRGPGGRGPGGRGPGGRGPGGRGPGGRGPGGGPWGGGPGGGGPGGGPGWANPWQKGGSKVGAFGSGYDEDEYDNDADADYLNDEDYDYYDGVGYNYDPSYPFKGYGQGEKGFSDPKTFPPWAFSPITNAAVPKFCYEKPDTSICPEKNTVDVKRWCYNPFLDICVPFKFYGCNENENNFHTLQICQSTCIDPGEHPPKSPGCDTETDIIMDELNNYDNSLSTADLSQIPD